MMQFFQDFGQWCYHTIPYFVGAVGCLIAMNGAFSTFSFELKGSQAGSQYWFPIAFALTRLGEMATGLVMMYFGFQYAGF